jgi:hypothetical protein
LEVTPMFAVDRRTFLRTAAATVAGTRFSAAAADPAGMPQPIGSFAVLKQIDAGVLNIGYADAGRAGAPVVLLLHGWPYDIVDLADGVTAMEIRRRDVRPVGGILRQPGSRRDRDSQLPLAAGTGRR